MTLRIYLACRDDSATNARRASNIAKLLRSPDINVILYNVPSGSAGSAATNSQVLAADFYLDCMPEQSLDPVLEDPRDSHDPKRESLVPLLAAHSKSQEELSEPMIEKVRKRLFDFRDRLQFASLRKTILEDECKGDHNVLSILAFASSGSGSVLTCMEHDVPTGWTAEGEGLAVQKCSTLRDPGSIALLQDVIDSITREPALSDLDGCFRVGMSIERANGAVADLKIDLAPRIFHYQQSYDDMMVSNLPGGHEALLCLLLTRHEQKLKGMTAKQATVRAAFDAISSASASSYDRIAHVAVMRSLAFQFSWDGSVLDVGCGQGVFGGLLNQYHPGVELYGTDMSEVMVEAPQIKRYYRSPIQIGPMEQALMASPTTDHIACFSVFQYVPSRTFLAAVLQMFLKARKSITFDIPEVDREYARKLTATNSLWRPSDHLAALDRIGTPQGWRLVMHRHCLTYTEPNYEHDVYSRYVRYEREG